MLYSLQYIRGHVFQRPCREKFFSFLIHSITACDKSIRVSYFLLFIGLLELSQWEQLDRYYMRFSFMINKSKVEQCGSLLVKVCTGIPHVYNRSCEIHLNIQRINTVQSLNKCFNVIYHPAPYKIRRKDKTNTFHNIDYISNFCSLSKLETFLKLYCTLTFMLPMAW